MKTLKHLLFALALVVGASMAAQSQSISRSIANVGKLVVQTTINATSSITGGNFLTVGSGGSFYVNTRAGFSSPADGQFLTTNFGATSSFLIKTTGVATCPTNCGTSPTVTGSDSSGTVVMGASGVPASGWIIQFQSAFSAAPRCEVTMALATMVVGKQAIVVVPTTTNFTVTTNGTAPSNSDVYTWHCFL